MPQADIETFQQLSREDVVAFVAERNAVEEGAKGDRFMYGSTGPYCYATASDVMKRYGGGPITMGSSPSLVALSTGAKDVVANVLTCKGSVVVIEPSSKDDVAALTRHALEKRGDRVLWFTMSDEGFPLADVREALEEGRVTIFVDVDRKILRGEPDRVTELVRVVVEASRGWDGPAGLLVHPVAHDFEQPWTMVLREEGVRDGAAETMLWLAGGSDMTSRTIAPNTLPWSDAGTVAKVGLLERVRASLFGEHLRHRG